MFIKKKKVSLIDGYDDQLVFTDRCGYGRISAIDIIVKGGDFDKYGNGNLRDYYIIENHMLQRIGSFYIPRRRLLELLLSKKIYRKKPGAHYGFSYDPFPIEEGEKAIYSSVEISIKYVAEPFDRNVIKTHEYSETIPISKKEDIDEIQGWYLKNSDINSFVYAAFADIKLNDELFYVFYGKVKVTKVYDYPNDHDLICDVTDLDGNVRTLAQDAKLFYLPYSDIEDEFLSLNHSVNELLLSPYIAHSDGTYNIHWQPREDAARYIVVAYRILSVAGRKRVYHMGDFEIDRNTHFLALCHLVGQGIVLKVKAEDRSGNVIAESRCLSDGFNTTYMK